MAADVKVGSHKGVGNDSSSFEQKNLVQVSYTKKIDSKEQPKDNSVALVGLVKKSRVPITQKVEGGVKVIDRDGYWRIAKDYAEATQLVQFLLSKGNSVMYMNGFESAKWKAPKVN